jgi:hypothetical protein
MRLFYSSLLAVSVLGVAAAACSNDPEPQVPPPYGGNPPPYPTNTQTVPPAATTPAPTATQPNILGIPIPSGLPSGMMLPSGLPIPSGLPGFPTAPPPQR